MEPKTETIFLFDWGNTLMVDVPGQTGKMYTWPRVEQCPGAEAVLSRLSTHHRIYIATSAAHSAPADIRAAFARVGVHRYISGYFCRQNVGCTKEAAEFYPTVLDLLETTAAHTVMVGDNLEQDILPCIHLGMQAVLIDSQATRPRGLSAAGYHIIHSLIELLDTEVLLCILKSNENFSSPT